MRTALSEFITEINKNRKSGLLSITVKGANTLLKLFFREGEVYHLTCGNVKGAGCLAQVTGNEFSDYFFMPDVTLNVQDGNLPPLPEIIRIFGGTAAAGAAPQQAGTGNPAPSAALAAGPGAVQEDLKRALIRQIGPAGAKVMARIVEQKWNAPSPPNREDFLRLAELLKEEIENDDDRNIFLKEARALLS